MKTRHLASCTAIQLALWIVTASSGPAWADDTKPANTTATEEKLQDRPLALVRQVRPTYPEAARKEALAGAVQLEVLIDEDGSVESVKTMTGNPILAEAAAAAVRRWVYQSAIVGGKAIKSTTVVKLNFKAPEGR